MSIDINQTPAALLASSIKILSDIVALDTTSRLPNGALIDYIEACLKPLGIVSHRIPSADGEKANLLARIGPAADGGVVLSGHTDVVPVDGQSWSSDPFVLTRRDGRLYGRGTSDMKSFLAVALAMAPVFARPGALKRPVHLAFSYDEEVGCLGAPALIEALGHSGPRPATVIVGEPTGMAAVTTHKGLVSYYVQVTGREAHSSLTNLGLSANMMAVRLMNRLVLLSDELARGPSTDSRFEPPHSTLTIGIINGGTAINILSRHCQFAFDLRFLPDADPDVVLAPFMAEVEEINREAKARFAEAGIVVSRGVTVPAFLHEPDGAAASLVRSLTGDNVDIRAVPFGSEAGQFQGAGYSTVICGPGSIEQAHQPDEYIEVDQIRLCIQFMLRLAESLGRS